MPVYLIEYLISHLYLFSVLALASVPVAYQISTWNQNMASLSVDRDLSSCSVTGYDTRPWLVLHLERPIEVTSIKLYGKHFIDIFSIKIFLA